MAVLTSTQNPFTFIPTGNTTAKPIFKVANGYCQTDSECSSSEICDRSNLVTFPLGQQYGICKPNTTTLTTETLPVNSGSISVFGSLVGDPARIVTVTAIPITGFRFVKWNIVAAGQLLPQEPTSTVLDIVMTANTTVTATFEELPSQLSITTTNSTLLLKRASNVTAQLQIVRNNIQNVDFVVTGLPSEISYQINNGISLTPTITFTNRGQTNGTIPVNVTIRGTTATGNIQESTARITINGTNIVRLVPQQPTAGRVSGNSALTPSPITTQPTGVVELETELGANATFNATPNTGFRFVGWYLNDDLNTLWRTTADQTVPVSTNTTYTAKFEQIISQTCTPPADSTRRISIECVTVDSSKYQSGIAYRTEIRAYDATVTGPGICPWTESTWSQSGTLDTRACILINSAQVCTAPTDTSQKEEQIDCTTISSEFSGGTAKQVYVRTYDTTQIGGICPWKNWEANGVPNTSTCIRKTSWRNCVTGELLAGSPPADFTQGTYQGNVCWEPISDLAFTPTLNEALRYSYQRGSSNFPQSKVITVTNSSYGTAYRVTLQTNSNIRLTHNNLSSNGTISFIIAARESKTFSIAVTQELLNSLPDGLATLSMNVEYIRVVE